MILEPDFPGPERAGQSSVSIVMKISGFREFTTLLTHNPVSHGMYIVLSASGNLSRATFALYELSWKGLFVFPGILFQPFQKRHTCYHLSN
jgi:hypothetical protein